MLQRIDLCHFRLNKSILQELWIFFACVYAKKICMLLSWGLKYSRCSTDWIGIYYKHICGNILILWDHSFMVSMHDTKSMPIGNSQLSKTGYKSCLLYYTVKQKVFTFKHGLNIGWSIYRLLIIHLHVQWINGNPCYKRC